MTVRVRLVVFGAILPTAALLAAALAAGWLFRRHQLEDLDRRLLAQAAVESVGLFDAPGGEPHVHVPESPIASQVKDFAPDAGVYDARGALVSRMSDPTRVPARVPFTGAVGVVRLHDDGPRRVLELPVRAPDGGDYTLWMGASLAPVDATMAAFHGAILSAVAVVAAILFAVQLVVARRLAARIDAMIAFLPRLRDGDTSLAPDPSGDELAALREAMRATALRLSEARAEQDRLLASAAHELRTPLTVLRTEIDLALRKDRPAGELRAALRDARDDVDRMAELATALLDLQAVRHVGFDRKGGDLAALVREACAGLATLAETRRVELRIDADGPARARFDERSLRQALDNLITNALKHAPEDSAIEVGVRRAGARWQLSVADRGPGVPPGEASRIFEPFHRAGGAPGAGLGLAIVREVAERHGGAIRLDDTHAPGARFVLELPA